MRGVILVVLLGYLAIVLRAESEPYFGSGSGDGTDVVVIAPTNGTKPPTDSTDDYGLGVDDEDDEDYASGSAMSSTTETPTTARETTTTARETTTTETATTETATTETATTSTTTIIIPDDEDDYSGSGSGSGSGLKNSTQPQDETTTTSTDIYITEVSTTDNTLIIQADEIITTTKSTKRESSTKQRPPSNRFKTTPKSASSVKYTPTTPSRAPSTGSWTTKSATQATTKMESKVTSLGVKTQAPKRQSTEQPRVRSTEQPKSESTEEPNVINKLWTRITTKQIDETTTPTQSGNIMARRGNKKEPGFTLTTEVIAGVVGCALLALLLIAFLMYRLKKRDEGSYLLDESNAYPVDYKKIHVSDKEAFI